MSDRNDQIDRLEANAYSAGRSAALWLEGASRGARRAPARGQLHRKRSLERAARAIAQEVAEGHTTLSNSLHGDLEA